MSATDGATDGANREPLPNNGNNLNQLNSQESKSSLFKYIRARTEWTKGFLPEPFRDMSFDRLAESGPAAQPAVAGVRDWTQGVRAGARVPLILLGPGAATTPLACCAWNELAPSVPDRKRFDDALLCGTADNIAFVRGDRLPEMLRPPSPWNARKDCGGNAEHLRTCLLCVLADLDLYPHWSDSSRLLCGLIKDRVSTHALPTILTLDMSLDAFARRHGGYGKTICDALREAGGVFVGVQKFDEITA